MVEDLDEGKKKLLFLTNPQADLIASTPESVQKMFDALEVPKPSLVIELLKCHGCRMTTNLNFSGKKGFDKSEKFAGISYERPPFITREQEREAESKLDMFMVDVIIPLAAQTHAVVLCDAGLDDCMLSAAFHRMYSTSKSKWAGSPPFTVLSLTPGIQSFYKNPDENAHWRTVRAASRAWRQRNSKLLEVHAPKSEDGMTAKDDLDPNASCIILTDNVDPKREKVDGGPFANLKSAIMRHLSSAVPSIALKTGFSLKTTCRQSSSLGLNIVCDRVQSGTPVLALDLRNRLPLTLPTDMMNGAVRSDSPENSSREALILQAKNQIDEWREQLLEAEEGKVVETYDVCTLAFLHEVLKSDGALSRNVMKGKRDLTCIPLHEAIRRAEDEERSDVVQDVVPPATQTQIAELARWHVTRVFRDAWMVRDDWEEREAKGETFHMFYDQQITAHEVHARTLLSSSNFFPANLNDMESAQKLVNQIVRLDRLPAINTLQGLLLLRSAWHDFDVAMLLAGRYKRVCKIIFALQLIVSWIVIVFSSQSDFDIFEGYSEHIVFALAVAFSILVSLDGILNPKSRWRQLRSSAMSLQSIIWQYRTRTGPFEVDEAQVDPSRPENVLSMKLNDWRDELIAGAGLQTSNLQRKYPAHVYRHYQDCGNIESDSLYDDDHQSPVQPVRYIKLRIEPMMDFYSLRIPRYTNHGFALKIVIILLGVISSVLARYEVLNTVVVVTAAATIVTSWAEFSEDSRKVERYSSVVTGLKKLLTWWDSLGEVKKASRESITHLVIEAEAIITKEQRSWTSTAPKQDTNESNIHKGGDPLKNPELVL